MPTKFGYFALGLQLTTVGAALLWGPTTLQYAVNWGWCGFWLGRMSVTVFGRSGTEPLR